MPWWAVRISGPEDAEMHSGSIPPLVCFYLQLIFSLNIIFSLRKAWKQERNRGDSEVSEEVIESKSEKGVPILKRG